MIFAIKTFKALFCSGIVSLPHSPSKFLQRGTKLEMVCAIVYQLTKDLSPEEIERSGFAPYYVDHTLALWPQAASGAPWTATYFQSKGDPITDLHEDLAAEQKARKTRD